MNKLILLIILGSQIIITSLQAVVIDVPDFTATPDGSDTAFSQDTDVSTPNGGNLLNQGTGTELLFVIMTFNFGTDTAAELSASFIGRLGVRASNNGEFTWLGEGDGSDVKFNYGQNMAGESVTILLKYDYDRNNNVEAGDGDSNKDTWANAWINPAPTSLEGASSDRNSGDMGVFWNSSNFSDFKLQINNQSTPSTADDSSITNVTILTGADATWPNALALATGTTAAADPGTSSVSASLTSVPANGLTESIITVTLRDIGGNPTPNKEVSLSGDGGSIITTSNNNTNSTGEALFTVTNNANETEVFTATVVTDNNLVVTETVSIDFRDVGPVDADNSTVIATPVAVLANGETTSIVTVILRDSNSIFISGEDVTLSASPANANISPVGAQATDPDGQVTFEVNSSTIGLVVFSATSATNATTITQTASVDFTDPQDAEAFNVKFLDGDPVQADVVGLIGVVGEAGETWNQGTTSVSNLLDTTGTVTSSVSVSGLGSDGRTLGSAALKVFDGSRALFGKGSDVTINITGLTAGNAYDLYIYSLSDNSGSWGSNSSTERASGDFVTSNTVLLGSQSQFLDNAIEGTNGNAFTPNANYVVFQSIVADPSGNIAVLVDAYDGVDGKTRLQVNGLQIRPATGISVDYSAWREDNFPGLGDPNEDDDADSLSNDFERIFGLDPTDAASIKPLFNELNPTTGAFSYTRRDPALVNLNYKLWYSTDLENWFEDNGAFQTIQTSVNDIETVDVQIDPTLLSEPKLFVQMRTSLMTENDPEPSLLNLWGSGSTITLLFSEVMNTSSAENIDNYGIAAGGGGSINVTDAALSNDGGSVTLTLDTPLATVTEYSVTLDSLTSGTGQAFESGLTSSFTTWDDNPNGIKVFILAGQSNMVGFGEVEEGVSGQGTIGSLRYMTATIGSNSDYDYASLLEIPSDPASAFASRSDVKVWYRDGGNALLGGPILKGDLGAPYMGRDSSKIGPEFGFGQIIGDFYPSDDVLIVKTAWGGRSLFKDFRSPSAVANRGGQVGVFFNATINYTRQVLNNLDTEFPEWAGRGYEIVGFGWHQGYNDQIDTTASNEYKDNLPDFISDIREVFNKPNLPFVIASTGNSPAGPGPVSGYSAVEQAQLWQAGVAQPTNVLSSDTRPFWRDPQESPATSGQGFHWNWNGESQFLIGKSLGDNMVNLLTP